MNLDPTNHCTNRPVRLAAGALLILVPSAFMVFFTLLQIRFDYPDILRQPAAEVLTRFAAKKGPLLPLWYGMFASAVLFIPLSLLVASAVPQERGPKTALLTFGVLAGLVQSIGLARWIFAVPALATQFVATTSPHEQHTITTTFNTLNSLLGVGIGEHMGYLFTVAWTLTLATSIRRERPAAAAIGAGSALAIAAGLLEPAGINSAATVNAMGYALWSLWLVWIGVLALLGKKL